MIPKELCHYTKKDIALEKILFEKKIRFGLIGLTNDPKESKWSPKAFMYPKSSGLTLEETSEVFNESERISKEEWKVLCMTKHLPKRKYREPMKNEIMAKFRHGYSRPRMWAQYADNHSGVCLIFDGKELHKKIEHELHDCCKIFQGAVTYKNYGSYVSEFIEYSDIVQYGLSDGIRIHYYKHYENITFFQNILIGKMRQNIDG